ncbi:MAG: WXG100 family type VII secretion target [Actinomadura sp.]
MKGSARRIKTGARPTGSVEGLDLEAIQARFSSTDPGAVIDAGYTYGLVADNLSEAEDEVARAIRYLTDHWRGDAADTALRELRKLEANARELSTRTRQTGDTLRQYGKILDKYQLVTLDPGFIRTKSDDRYAQQLMARLNTRTAEAYDALPDQVGLADANVSPAAAPSTAGGTIGGASGGGSSALPGPAVHGPGGAGTDGSGARLGPGGDAAGGGTDLAGMPGTGPGPGTGLGPGLGPGGGSAMPGAGAVPGGAVGSPGAGTTAFIGPGAGQGRGMAGGRGAGLGRSGVIGAGGLVGGAPAGGSDGEEERSREFWLAEERDTWSGDGAVVSGVVGQEEDHRPLPSGDEPGAIDLDDDRLIEDLDSGLPDLPALDDGEVEIVEADTDDVEAADQEDYDAIDEFLDEVLGDDELGAGST